MKFWHDVCLAVQETVMPAFIVHVWWMQQNVPHARLIFRWGKCCNFQALWEKKDKYKNMLKDFH